MTSWGSNRLCKTLLSDEKQRRRREQQHVLDDAKPPSVLVNMTFGCREMFETHEVGTGNWIWLFYAMRLAARAHGNVDFNAKCADEDAERTREQLVIPWIIGHFGPDNEGSVAAEQDESLLRQACGGQQKAPLWHMIPAMRRDLGIMAESLVGVPEWHGDRLDGQVKTNPPKYGDIELDETAWHFRCGDVMYSRHSGYAWHQFGLLASHIPDDTRSIGIVTQPFDNHRTPQMKALENAPKESVLRKSSLACERLAHTLVDYLQSRFPSARVRIRNDPSEGVALAYSRMIAAKHTVVGGVSTFGAYAALASWGRAVVIAPDFDHAPGKWLLAWEKSRTEDDASMVMVHDPHPLLLPDAIRLWWMTKGGKDAMIEWLTDDTEGEIIVNKASR